MVIGGADAVLVDAIVVLLAAEAGEPDGEKRENEHAHWESASNEHKNPKRSPPIISKRRQTDPKLTIYLFLCKIKASPQRDERASIASLRKSNNWTPMTARACITLRGEGD